MHCDFCTANEIVRQYPARDVELYPGHRSRGPWAACHACSDCLDREDREGLLKVCLYRYMLKHGRKVAEKMLPIIQLSLEKYFANRTGPGEDLTAAQIEALHNDPAAVQMDLYKAEQDKAVFEDINWNVESGRPAPRPMQYCLALARKFPDVWKMVESLRHSRQTVAARTNQAVDVRWPADCYLPRPLAVYLSSRYGEREDYSGFDEVAGAWIAALSAWRMTQGIYRFDESILPELLKTPLDRELPGDIFTRLPEWCVYIETPGWRFGKRPMHGFFAFLDALDTQKVYRELVLLSDLGEGEESELFVHPALPAGSGSLDETLRQSLDGVAEARAAEMIEATKRPELRPMLLAQLRRSLQESMDDEEKRTIRSMVSLLLYLCCQNAEVLDRVGKRQRPGRPRPVKTKQGLRLYAPDGPTRWDVAFRLGAAFRRAMEAYREPQGGTHASPRPHVRTAHWHSFWTGQRAKPGLATPTSRLMVIHWLPPIPVNVKDDAPLVPAIRAVTGG